MNDRLRTSTLLLCWVLGLFALVSLVTACRHAARPPTTAPPAHSAGSASCALRIEVVDGAGRSVSPATLVVIARPVTRAPVIVDVSSGEACVDVPAGAYSITATTMNRMAGVVDAHLEPGRQTTVALRVSGAAFTISGRIEVADSRPARPRPFAERFTGRSVEIFSGIVDDVGRYSLALPAGTYAFGAGAEGYEDAVEARLPPYDDLKLDILLYPKQTASDVATSSWIRRSALAVRVDGPLTKDERAELRARIGPGATVVGLGEATHGTREFALLRWRLFEALVLEAGFRVFLAEAGWTESLAVDEYVTKGRGDPRKALAGLGYPMWRTPEALALVEWMRRYNAGRRDNAKVHFVGVDMQYPARTLDALKQRLDDEQPPLADVASLKLLADRARRSRTGLEPERVAAAQELVDRIRAVPLHATGDATARAELVQLAAVALQAAEMDALEATWSEPWMTFDSVYRDRAMAENILWILRHRFPGAKAVFSAHSLHVSLAPWNPIGVPSVGLNLQRALGESYVSLGMLFGQGSFAAHPAEVLKDPSVPPQSFTAPAPVEGEVEHAFAQTGLATALVDLRAADPEALSFLRSTAKVRHHDLTVHTAPNPIVPLRAHHLLLYVHETSATLPTIDR